MCSFKQPFSYGMWLDVELGSLLYLYCLWMPTEIVGGWVLNVQLLAVAYVSGFNKYKCLLLPTVDTGEWF